MREQQHITKRSSVCRGERATSAERSGFGCGERVCRAQRSGFG
jgi:hypothetical protein